MRRKMKGYYLLFKSENENNDQFEHEIKRDKSILLQTEVKEWQDYIEFNLFEVKRNKKENKIIRKVITVLERFLD